MSSSTSNTALQKLEGSAHRIRFKTLIYYLGQLVNALSGIVGVHVGVLGPEVAPLEAVDRSEVTLLAVLEAARVEEGARAVPVPDPDVLLLKLLGVGRTPDEPMTFVLFSVIFRFTRKI